MKIQQYLGMSQVIFLLHYIGILYLVCFSIVTFEVQSLVATGAIFSATDSVCTLQVQLLYMNQQLSFTSAS